MAGQVPIPMQSMAQTQLQVSIDSLRIAQHNRFEYEALFNLVIAWTCAVDTISDDMLTYQDKVHAAECALRAAVGVPAPSEVGE
jgi:hypothetical protein